jgi:hypothetical protein
MPVSARARGAVRRAFGCGVVGEALEPRTTTGTQATTGTIASVLAAAVPGDTILLRAGTYAGFTIPAGTSGNPITVKPYDGEAVVINSQFTMNSFTRLGGVKAESSAAQWLTRIGSTTSTAVEDVELRNSTVRGGTQEAIRVRRNAQNIRLTGLDVEGGRDTHTIFFWDDDVGDFFPSGSITNCLVRKRMLADGGIYDYTNTEDLIQLDGSNTVTIDRVTFGDMPSVSEDGIDVKTMQGTTPSTTVTRCWFKGPFAGTFDNATVLQCSNDNMFVRNCRVSSGNLLVGTAATSTATLERVVVDSGATIIMQVSGDSPRAHGVQLFGINQTGGTLKFGTSTAGDQPHNVELSGCRFNGTNIILNTGTTYTCDATNVFTACTGATLTCG